jgi:SOS-response transcriptional repressor LexA
MVEQQQEQKRRHPTQASRMTRPRQPLPPAPPSRELTERQREVLSVVYRIRMFTDRSPTFKEMREALGVESNNAIETHLAALECKGMINRVMVDEQDAAGRWRMRSVDLTDTGRHLVPDGTRIDVLEQLVVSMRR